MSIEKPPLASSGLARTRSEQLYETIASAFKSPHGSMDANGIPATDPPSGGGGGTLSRKSSRRLSGGAGAHIRKSRSAQLKHELEEVSSGAALSRASSASLGLSFSFTGFAMPPEEISDSKPFSDDEMIPEDIEAGNKKPRFQAEPTLPIYLKFREVTHKVMIKKLTSSEEKEILSGITGSVNPGEVLALMGPSGSGKTTLLSLLGGRISQSSTGGLVTYNDKPYSKFLKSKIGFVTQDDVLFPHLTVKETLTYAARLRLPKTLTREQKEQRALEVIQELGLERCQDTMIGGAFVRGVSGGERKRVSIGNEIIINPSLLLLDEPTSGLDSTTALRTIQMLHDIAKAGKTVITTIHQPSSRLFHRFDKLILLGRGNLLYFGKSSEALVYFSSIGCSPLITMNPAEFLLDLANGNINDISVPSELEDRVQVGNSGRETPSGKPSPAVVHEYLVEAYETRVAEQEKKKLMDPVPLDEESKAKVQRLKRQWGASWWEQYSILFCRGLKERRHEYFSWLRVTQVLSTAVILGLLWWQSDIRTPKGLQDQAGLLFFIAVFWGFFPVFTAIFAFPQERAMLNKERAADMYRLSAYFMARTTSDLPLDFILPSLFLLVVYFMAGLRLSPYPFFLSMLTTFLCIIAAQGLGLAIGAVLMDLKKATTLASVTVMTFMLAGGFFVKKVPVFISWIRYLSFNYHTYKLLLKVQYQDFAQTINGMRIDNGLTEVVALVVMIFGYRLLAYLSLSSQDRTIRIWETTQGKLIHILKGHGHWVNSLALSTDYVLRTGAFDHTGKAISSDEEMKKVALERYKKARGENSPERLVSGSDDFTMILWEPSVSLAPKKELEKEPKKCTGHQQLVNHVCFSPNGQWIASASFDNSVKLWNGITGEYVTTFRGHVDCVNQISWSADSRMILSCSKDTTLKIWDIRTRKLKQDLPGHFAEVYAVDWSPDGERVASGGKDKVLKLWKG